MSEHRSNECLKLLWTQTKPTETIRWLQILSLLASIFLCVCDVGKPTVSSKTLVLTTLLAKGKRVEKGLWGLCAQGFKSYDRHLPKIKFHFSCNSRL